MFVLSRRITQGRHAGLLAACLGAMLLPAPALAWDHCEDLWFTRNLIFDRAGYCFGSPLGQALFDNADCSGGEVALSPVAQETVAYIREVEALEGCHVDTSQVWIDIPMMRERTMLEDLPAMSQFASGCIGWKGRSVPLFAGHTTESLLMFYAEPGQDIVWEFETFGTPQGWEFLTVYDGGVLQGFGWSHTPIRQELCTGLAG